MSLLIERAFFFFELFYRFDSKALYAERLIHGARDLPRRLLQLPGAA